MTKTEKNELDFIDNAIKIFHEDIVNKTENKKMPLLVFNEFFLQYFNGSEEIKNDNPIISKWIEFAGSVFSPVDIIDSKGKIVNTVPALYIKNENNMRESKNIDYSTISSEFNLISKRSGVAGDAYIENTLNNVSKKINKTDTEKSNWNNVMNTLGSNVKGSMTTIKVEEENYENELNYD